MRPEEGSLSSPDLSEGSLPLIHNLPPTLFQEKGRPRVHFSELRDGAVLDVKINAFMNVCSWYKGVLLASLVVGLYRYVVI